MAERDEETFFRLLVDRVEPALARATRPMFLVDYPASQASLARDKADRIHACASASSSMSGGVELCNGFGELTDPVRATRALVRDQAARGAAGKPVYPIDERFLAALEEGMPPSAGNALGLDRLVALCASGGRRSQTSCRFPVSLPVSRVRPRPFLVRVPKPGLCRSTRRIERSAAARPRGRA